MKLPYRMLWRYQALYRKWRDRISNAWWTIVVRVDRKAYLRHRAKKPLSCGSEIFEELLWLDTEEWKRRGAKVNVWVDDIPLPEGVKTPWVASLSGPPYIRWDIVCKFRKMVEDAEYEKGRRRREGREIWVKYFTAIAAALAALASVANLYFSNKKK